MLVDRHAGGVAINRRTGRKNNGSARGGRHGLQQAEKAAHVVAEIFQRFSHTFADRLEASEVNGRGAVVGTQNLLNQVRVQRIAALADNLASGELLESLQHRRVAVREIVKHHGPVAGFHQRNHGVAADVACAAGQQY